MPRPRYPVPLGPIPSPDGGPWLEPDAEGNYPDLPPKPDPMSLNRYAAARDKNEPEIVEALEKAGYTVERLSGKGVPDLLVGKHNRIWLIEVKSEKNPLTTPQFEWIQWFGGNVGVCRTVEQVLAYVSEEA